MIYAVLVLIAVAFLFNNIFRKYAAEKLQVRREILKKIVEIDEEFEINLIVENKKILPISYLEIEERLHGSFEYKFKSNNIIRDRNNLYHRAVMIIMPYQRVKRTYKLYSTKRGAYFIQDIKLVIGDLLGVGFDRKDLTIHHEIVVLPARYDMEKNLIPIGDFNGNISVKRWIMEDPILTIGVREYTGLEPQKNIHWPSTLRAGKLMVKSFDYTTDNSSMILLNIETNKPFWLNVDSEGVEKCISIARSVVEGLEESKIPHCFDTNAQMGNFIADTNIAYPGLGENHLYYILEGLGRINYGISAKFEEKLQNIISHEIRYTTYILITPLIFDEYVEYINMLGKRCEKLIIISLSQKNVENLNDGIECYVEEGERI